MYQIMKHRLDDPDYLNECFDYDNGFLIWKERPRNHFKTFSAATRWNNEHVGRVAQKHDYPEPHTILNGGSIRTSTLVYLYHLAKTPNYKHVKFEGDYGVYIPYGVKDGELLYTPRVLHHNKVRCDNRIENLYVGPQQHIEAYQFARDVRFRWQEEPDQRRFVVYAIEGGKPTQIMGYTKREKDAKDLYFQCRRIYE
jgi:hypothetical protein